MPEPPEPELQTSKVRPWLRALAWLIPGISAPGVLLATFAFTYGGGYGDWIFFPLLGGFILLTLACAFFDAVLTLPTRSNRTPSKPKAIAKAMLIFVLFQILIVPALGTATAFGCTTVMQMAT